MLAERLPSATHLALAFFGLTRMSPGTARTLFEKLGDGGRARIDGRVTEVPFAWKIREIPFRGGVRKAMTIPWGDVVTAYHTTGIPNIEVYNAMPGLDPEKVRPAEKALRLLRFGPVRAVVRWITRGHFRGPSESERNSGRVEFWGRVADDAGQVVEATLETPEAYHLTVRTALEAAMQVLAGAAPPGFCTPAAAFGAEWILDFDGTELQWCET
jgi:short subunit dehydrogenase-like uncharacterized protein